MFRVARHIERSLRSDVLPNVQSPRNMAACYFVMYMQSILYSKTHCDTQAHYDTYTAFATQLHKSTLSYMHSLLYTTAYYHTYAAFATQLHKSTLSYIHSLLYTTAYDPIYRVSLRSHILPYIQSLRNIPTCYTTIHIYTAHSPRRDIPLHIQSLLYAAAYSHTHSARSTQLDTQT